MKKLSGPELKPDERGRLEGIYQQQAIGAVVAALGTDAFQAETFRLLVLSAADAYGHDAKHRMARRRQLPPLERYGHRDWAAAVDKYLQEADFAGLLAALTELALWRHNRYLFYRDDGGKEGLLERLAHGRVDLSALRESVTAAFLAKRRKR